MLNFAVPRTGWEVMDRLQTAVAVLNDATNAGILWALGNRKLLRVRIVFMSSREFEYCRLAIADLAHTIANTKRDRSTKAHGDPYQGAIRKSGLLRGCDGFYWIRKT
ncbi:MAG: hypothetical protein KDA81_22160 [Planctomycetaceae bacterium]|nr:hypothetical protein [Planctomycetaceae bacterium]